MHIEWDHNPLKSRVILNDHDKEIFYLKFELEQWKDTTVVLHMALENADFRENAEQQYKYVWADGNGADFTKRADYYMEDLLYSHGGDCTCDACSCSKCHAESILGIDTIAGLGKHQAAKIGAAFRSGKTLNEVIEHLFNYELPKSPPWEGAEYHYSRWAAEARSAYDWLFDYRAQHFPEEISC